MLVKPGICLFTGSMKSGKTDQLLKVWSTCHSEKRALFGFTRSSLEVQGEVSSRSGRNAEARLVPSFSQPILDELIANETIISVFIDEGQFFDNLATTANLLARHGKRVYIAALNGTFECLPWSSITALLAVCDQVLMLHAYCDQCQDIASFSKRMTASKQVVEIGSHYQALCRSCFYATPSASSS